LTDWLISPKTDYNLLYRPAAAQAPLSCAPLLSFIFFAQILTEKAPAVLVLVTIDAEILPVGTIRRVIPVVAVFMMNGQELAVLIVELSSALGTDEAVDFNGLLPVIT
jgi:hypothetical protein